MIRKIINSIINKLDIMLLITILIALYLFVMVKPDYTYIQIIICSLMIIYMLFKAIKKQNIQLVQSKLDLFVILFVLSPLVPFISNSYISLSETVSSILLSFTLLCIYFLVREISKRNPSNIKYIKNIFIIITVLLIFIGIETLTTNNILKWFGIKHIANGENRLVSFITNPNTFASLIMFVFFICLHEMINSSKFSSKVFYSVCLTIFLLGILLTYSKLTFVIFPVLLLIYTITSHSKSKTINVIITMLQAVIMSLIYMFVFQNFVAIQKYTGILIFSIVWFILEIIISILSLKLTCYLEKIDTKILLISGFILVTAFILFIIVGLTTKTDFVVFDYNGSLDYNSKIINNIEPNKDYVFTFDMESNYLSENNEIIDDMFTIKIIERDSKSLDEIASKEFVFGNFSGKKEIKIHTSNYTSEIKVEFKAKYAYVSKQWIIKSLNVNGQEVTLEYKYLPTKLVEKIGNINLQYKTAQERFEFLKDGLKLISRNFLTGIGGDGWDFKYGEVQEYGYVSSNPHSYYIEIWLSYGLLGLISILGILWCIIKPNYKNNSDKIIYQGLQFGLFAILLHTAIDADMNTIIMQFILFMSIGIFSTSSKKSKDVNSCEKISQDKGNFLINGIFIIILIIIIFLLLNPQIYDKYVEIENLQAKKAELEDDSFEYKELCYDISIQYENMAKYERDLSSALDSQYKSIEYYILSGKSNLEDKICQYYEFVLPLKNTWKHDSARIIEKARNINFVIAILEKQNDPKLYPWIAKLAQININEYEETKKDLLNAINEKHTGNNNNLDYNHFMNIYEYAYNKYHLYASR